MEHLSVAIADDNQRILDMLDDIIQTDIKIRSHPTYAVMSYGSM